MSAVQEFVHLTWRGRIEMLFYPLRRLFIADAPAKDRCFMGAPIGDHVHCPRPAVGYGLWCKRHQPAADVEQETP